MFAVKRNQVLVTVLAVMVAAAGYINFKSADSEGMALNGYEEYTYESAISDDMDITVIADDVDTAQTAEVTEGTELAEETGITDPLTAEVLNTEETDDTGAAVLVSAGAEDTDTYFVQAKLDREQSRAKQQGILTDIINNTKLSDSQKEEAASGLIEIQERIEKETASEDMIKAKGFSEAYVRIDDETVDVVVKADTLTEQQLAQIEDIVTRKTGYSADKIRISPLKN